MSNGGSMSQRTVIVYTDDVTGEDTQEGVTVTLLADGNAYQLDMGPDTYAEYQKVIEPYRAAARRIGRAKDHVPMAAPLPNPVPAQRDKAAVDTEQRKAVRAWWGSNQGRDGLPEMTNRGRIPEAVYEAFQRHQGRPIDAAPDVKPAQEKRAAVRADVKIAKSPRKPASPAKLSFADSKSAGKAAGRQSRRVSAG